MEQKPKLLEQIRAVAREQHLSNKTEDVYPKEMGSEEITAFLYYLKN